jgi:DNA-binding transcriptional LysR family regulator
VARTLDIDLLRSFVVIAETRTLSHAAERVGRTQSALSQQIKRLEQTAGQALFQRTGRGVVLTEAGERLLHHAHRMLRLHDEALAEVSGRGLSGSIRFGCPDDYAQAFLPALLRGFAARHPQVRVELHCAPTPRLCEQLRRHALDLALTSLPDTAAPRAVIRREPLVWVGGPGMDARAHDPLPLALSDPDTLDHVAALEALRRAGRAWRIACASSSLSGLTALVRSGQAFAVLTRSAVPDDLQVLRQDSGLPALPEVCLAIQADDTRAGALAEAFSAHIRAMLPLL